MGIDVKFSNMGSKIKVDGNSAVYIRGEDGEDGATFYPEISEDGTLSWTNDKELENPEPVNIKGPQGPAGEDGRTPVKGIDYFDGKDGKSAYEYAKDGGYTGTEAEFAELLVSAESIDDKADKSEGVFFIKGSGTVDRHSKMSIWTGTSDRITEYYDGLAIRYKIGVAGGAATTTLNINGLGKRIVYLFDTTNLTEAHFPVNSIINLIYHTDLNGGCWVCSDYDSNNKQRIYPSTTNTEFQITTRYTRDTGDFYYEEYGRCSEGVTLNPSTKTITATAFKGKLIGNADTATKAIQDASGNVITSTYETKQDAQSKIDEVNSQITQLTDNIPNEINQALAEAKASGEFNGPPGEPGKDGYTPVKGRDYFTDADKQEIAEQASEYVDLTGYATEEYVKNKIAEAELEGENVDLSGYAQKSDLPTKVSQLENDANYLTSVPVTSVNGKTGDVTLDATAVGARPSTWTPTASDVGALPEDTVIPTVPTNISAFTNDAGYLTEHQSLADYAKTDDLGNLAFKDSLSASDVGADVSGAASSAVSSHNTNTDAHNDIRELISGLTTRLNTLANSDDTTLDQMSEIVAYIKNNKSLIDGITTSKINVSDIINNLTTNVSNKPLSAAQGVALKALIDAIVVPTKVSELTNDKGYLTSVPVTSVNNKTGAVSLSASDVGALPSTTKIPSSLSDLTADTTHRTVTDTEKSAWNAKAETSSIPTKVSQLTNDAKYLTSVPSEYVTETEMQSYAQPKGNYLTAVPSEYVTETELNAKKYLTSYTETDPTVPAWAKAATKPSYTKSEVGLGNVDNVKQYSASNPPPYPVTKVNNKTGVITLSASDVGALAASELNNAIDNALAQAKESGEFDGESGVYILADGETVEDAPASANVVIDPDEDGTANFGEAVLYSPQTLTEAQKEQARNNMGIEAYIAEELAKRGQLKPEFAKSLEWLKANGDTTKLYVLSDKTDPNYGYIYTSVAKTVEGGTTPNFTNRLPYAEDIDTQNPLNGCGYLTQKYLTTSYPFYNAGTANEWLTGYIPYTIDKSIYIKGISSFSASHDRLYFFASDDKTDRTAKAVNGTNISTYYTVEQLDTDYFKFTPINGTLQDEKTTGYMRLGFTTGTPTEVIITVNEEITYTTVEGGIFYEWTNTGHAFVPADYEDRIIVLEKTAQENTEKLASVEKTVLDILSQSGDVSEGVQAAASAVVDKAMSREGNRVLRFLISSDAHQKNDHVLITKGTLELGQAQGEILKLIGVDFVANLGDVAWAAYTNTVAEVVEQIKTYKRLTASGIKGENQLWCEGNHDDGNYSLTTYPDTPKLTASAINTLFYSENRGVVYDDAHMVDGYCYKDIDHLKVRVICLNTEQGTGDGGVIENYQLTWLETVALNMTNKTDWSVITLAHHPLSFGTTSLNSAAEIIDAFINRGGNYIGHFHGHAHAFSVVKMQKNVNGTYTDINAWEICVPNACYTRSNQYLGNANERIARYSTPTTYNKSDVDGQRTSFNLVTVCLDEKKIYADNYGAGIDREISY